MVPGMLSKEDLSEIRAKGISPDEVIAQIEQFKKGFPFMRLDRPCTVGDGIVALTEAELKSMAQIYSGGALSGRAMKFVPASGAASRMFKSLLAVEARSSGRENESLRPEELGQDPDGIAALKFFREIRKFAFYEHLKAAMAKEGLDLEEQLAEGRYAPVLEYTLTPQGLGLADLPKGLIPFHVYPQHTRTAFEEHLAEAVLYVKDRDGRARIHFTISPEHKNLVVDHIEKVRSLYERDTNRLAIGFSVQEPATDTVAVDMENKLFHDQEGRLIFRPGGHGALLRNLNELKGDIVFIKNIDNVVPDSLKEATVTNKKALGGCLMVLQERIHSYLKRLREGDSDPKIIGEILEFLRRSLFVVPPDSLKKGSIENRRRFLLERLDRPLRVCGMVKNKGEPGGGPYWVEHEDGSRSLQIVESSQVDMNSRSQRAIWESSTHFNPVDLVCAVRDDLGRPFDLMRFRDPDTGFISVKSKDGREIKALELPGLWNGAMAFWNTVFVEVPSSTFSPVKAVPDLLRKEHQAG